MSKTIIKSFIECPQCLYIEPGSKSICCPHCCPASTRVKMKKVKDESKKIKEIIK